MDFKLIVALIADEHTDKIVETARELGATGATVITSGRGEGLKPHKTFFGLTMEGQVDMVLFIVESHLCRDILEGIAEAAQFNEKHGTGIAMQLDIEDAVGMKAQSKSIEEKIGDHV